MPKNKKPKEVGVKKEAKKAVDKDMGDFKRYIMNRVEYFMKEFILLDFSQMGFSFEESDHKEQRGTVFIINHCEVYHRGTISVYPIAFKMWNDGNLKDIDDGLIHELCHIHTIPICDLVESRFITKAEMIKTGESLTEVIAEYVRTIVKLKNELNNKKK